MQNMEESLIRSVHKSLFSEDDLYGRQVFHAERACAISCIDHEELHAFTLSDSVKRDIKDQILTKCKTRLEDIERFQYNEMMQYPSSKSLLECYNHFIAVKFYKTMVIPFHNSPMQRTPYEAHGDPEYLYNECLRLSITYQEQSRSALSLEKRAMLYKKKLMAFFGFANSPAKLNVLYQFAAQASSPVRMLFEAIDRRERKSSPLTNCLADVITSDPMLSYIMNTNGNNTKQDSTYLEADPYFINYPSEPPFSSVPGMVKEHAFQFQKKMEELQYRKMSFAEALESIAQPPVAPSLMNITTLKVIEDMVAMRGAGVIKQIPLLLARSFFRDAKPFLKKNRSTCYALTGTSFRMPFKDKMLRCLLNKANRDRGTLVKHLDAIYGPESATRVEAMPKRKVGVYNPPIMTLTKNEELTSPENHVRPILQSLISRLTDLQILNAFKEPCGNAQKYVRYISVPMYKIGSCRAKCIPENKAVEYVYATTDLAGPDVGSAFLLEKTKARDGTIDGSKGGGKGVFTQANSLRTFATGGMGGDSLLPICLSHTRLYPSSLVDFSMFLWHCEHVKLVAKSKQAVTYPDMLEPNQLYSGIALCHGSRLCYNQITLTTDDLKLYCNSHKFIKKTCGVCKEYRPTCVELFEKRFFPYATDHKIKKTMSDHLAFKSRIKNVAKLMPLVLCQGCISYYCCTDHDHDHDVLYCYIRQVAIPLLRALTDPIGEITPTSSPHLINLDILAPAVV